MSAALFKNSINANWFPKNQNLNDSFFKPQIFVINNFYNSYELPGIYFRKEGIIVRNKRLTI